MLPFKTRQNVSGECCVWKLQPAQGQSKRVVSCPLPDADTSTITISDALLQHRLLQFENLWHLWKKDPRVEQTEGKSLHYLIFAPARKAVHRLLYLLSGLFSETLAVCLVVVSKPKLDFWFKDAVFLPLTFHLLSSLQCWYTPLAHPLLIVLFYSSGNCFMSPWCSCIKINSRAQTGCRLERSHLGNRPFSAVKHMLSFQTHETVTLSAYESRSLWLSGKCGNCFKTLSFSHVVLVCRMGVCGLQTAALDTVPRR